jgi:hypothetical protein
MIQIITAYLFMTAGVLVIAASIKFMEWLNEKLT